MLAGKQGEKENFGGMEGFPIRYCQEETQFFGKNRKKVDFF